MLCEAFQDLPLLLTFLLFKTFYMDKNQSDTEGNEINQKALKKPEINKEKCTDLFLLII